MLPIRPDNWRLPHYENNSICEILIAVQKVTILVDSQQICYEFDAKIWHS